MYDQCLNQDLQQMGMEEKTTKKLAAKIVKDKAEKCKQEKEELKTMKACMETMRRAHRTPNLMANKRADSEELDTDNKKLSFLKSGDNALFWVQCDAMIFVKNDGYSQPNKKAVHDHMLLIICINIFLHTKAHLGTTDYS
uniref:Uncharacterized protein n=1 Tax=Romanomermis culicivorax TaxID=13658 RepID=A0A915HPF7_ROMCU